MTDAREQFTALSTCLIRDIGEPIEFREAAYNLYALFNEIGGKPQDVVGAEAFTWQQETLLPTGKAINPNAAATCLLDYARTRAFARGVHDAIEAAKIRFPDERIEILYAGTGPYAPLALMQTPFFGSDEVRFTLIDMHASALSCQAQVISVLGLEDYVEESVQADATQWIPPDEKQYHVAIAEVMQRALIVEPQVAVTLALSKHMRPDGLLVPERIELTLCLLDPGAEQTLAEACAEQLSDYFCLSGDSIPDAIEFQPDVDFVFGRKRLMIGRQFVLTDSVAEAYEVTDGGRICLPPVQLPDRLPPRHEFRILTEITTFGDIVLGDYDCGLTLPQSVLNEPTLMPDGFYEVWYETRGIPGLRLQRADRKPVDSFPPFGQSREFKAESSTKTMTESISHENFSGYLNAPFRIDAAETSLDLELIEVEVGKPIDPSLREPFTLIFQGPKDAILPEGTHNVSNDDAGSFELYIIPIVSVGDQQSYQVIFN